MEKTLEELRAAIAQDQEDAKQTEDDTGTQSKVESKEEDASTTEGTSNEASIEDPSEGTSEEEQWIVPGRFKTQADVLKAYQELESFTGRQSSEIQKLRSAISEPPRRGESQEEKNARLQRFADELTKDPEAALEARMRKIVNEVKGDVKANEFKRAYEARLNDPNSDFATLEPIMTQIATEYSDMIINNGMQNDPRLLDILHLAAKGYNASKIAAKAKEEGVKKGQELSRQKGKAKVEGPNGKTTTKKQDLSKLSAAEMKALMLKGDIDISE